MSAALVIEEIRRFLASEKAEVLCVKGRWGVGKTYAWRHYLHEARRDKTLHATKYSYVSLFGLNSLDDVRYAIFEGTVAPAKALTGPDIESVGDLLEKGKSLGCFPAQPDRCGNGRHQAQSRNSNHWDLSGIARQNSLHAAISSRRFSSSGPRR